MSVFSKLVNLHKKTARMKELVQEEMEKEVCLVRSELRLRGSWSPTVCADELRLTILASKACILILI